MNTINFPTNQYLQNPMLNTTCLTLKLIQPLEKPIYTNR